MGREARSMLSGVLVGLFLALLVQQFLSTDTQLPALVPGTSRRGPTSSHHAFSQVADMLRNPLQMARSAVRGVGSYKSARTAASMIHRSTITPTPTTSPSSHTKPFSTSPSTMASEKPFLQAVKERRTFYQLNKEAPISDKKIVDLVEQAVLHVPSSFNSQSSRLVVLLNQEHDTFWDFVLEVLKPMVPEEQFPSTEKRISGFKAGYGTILFFEDPEPVRALQKAYALYAEHFPTWSEHTSAMHQFTLWVGLEAEGFGANLQHYNPVIDRKAKEHWNVPLEWQLRAQLVFGGRAGEPGDKEFKPLEERLFVHGAKQ